MAFWFCHAKQYDPEVGRSIGGAREIVESSCVQGAKRKFGRAKKDLGARDTHGRLLLETYGFFGPFQKLEMARDIKDRYIRKKKRHSWGRSY